MVRTALSLETEDKAWLGQKAREEQVSMAELMRRAIRLFRKESEDDEARVAASLQDIEAGRVRFGSARDLLDEEKAPKAAPSKWARIVRRVEEDPVHLDGYSERLKKDMRELRENFEFNHDR